MMGGQASDTRDSILVLDLGSTNLKATLLGLDASVLGVARCSYPTHRPRADWAEQDPNDWWNAAISCLRALRDQARLRRVSAIVPTGQMHGLVPIGGDGQAIGRCFTLGDHRGAPQAQELRRRLGERRCYEITGAQIEGRLPIAKMMWLRENDPNTYHQAHHFLAPKDYLTMRLCGTMVTEPIDAAGFGLLDLRTRGWSAELVEAARIAHDKLPPVHFPQSIAGSLLPAAAKALSLQPGIPVVVGAGDDIECLGAGLIGGEVALEHLGSTGSMLVCVDRPLLDPEGGFEVYPHAAEGQWIAGGSTSASGLALDWARRFLWGDVPGSAWYEPNPLPQRKQGALVFLPHLNGARCPQWHDAARGLFIGLDLQTDRYQAAQAVYEGVAFSLRRILGMLERQIGVVKSVIVSGSEATDSSWLQLRANIYERTLRVSAFADTTSLGAMMLGAVAIGAARNLGDVVHSLVTYPTQVSPDPRSSGLWREQLSTYERVEASLSTLFPAVTGQDEMGW